MHYQDPDISKLISGFAKGTLSSLEKKQLDKWLLDKQHRRLFNKALEKEKILKKSFEYDRYESEKVWDKLDKQLFAKNMYMQWLKYAVAITLPLLLAVSVFYLSDTSQSDVHSHTITPGVKKATLFLSDGSAVELDKEKTNKVIEDGQLIGVDTLNSLQYIHGEVTKEVFNTLKIPVGGEYNLKLSDGTVIWLNSGSELRYPVNFVSDKREVYITGEGFFDVAHDNNKLFIVHTKNADIRVYGTRFNVMSYDDDILEQVTLVEGEVGVIVDKQQTVLAPGQQAELLIKNSKLEIKEVDTSYYTGWVDGVMKFKNMPLKELSKRIARWYDVDFYFANNNVAEFGFSGKFDRDCDFNLLMELLERTTNVKIEIDGRTVVVKEVQ